MSPSSGYAGIIISSVVMESFALAKSITINDAADSRLFELGKIISFRKILDEEKTLVVKVGTIIEFPL